MSRAAQRKLESVSNDLGLGAVRMDRIEAKIESALDLIEVGREDRPEIAKSLRSIAWEVSEISAKLMDLMEQIDNAADDLAQ